MTSRQIIVPVYLAACLLLGGASAAGFTANLILQLAALPIIAWAVWTMARDLSFGPSRGLMLLLVATTVALLVQLVPLPPSLWTSLPGRGPVAQGLGLLGVPLPWLPLSLAPEATLASLLWLLPAIAVLLATLILRAFRASWISWAILAVTALSVAVGALQVVGGRDGGAYLYRFTNYGQAVGFFANSNHTATLLLVAIPFLAALQTSMLRRAPSARNASAVRILVWAFFIVIAVGLLTNFSLAGLGLSVPVALLSFLAFGRKRKGSQRLLLGAVLVLSSAAIAAILVGPYQNNLTGQQRANVELSRQTSFRLTMQAAREYFPLGSGVGSFQAVYHTQEPLPTVTTTYMNHAHSDWLEILLETGLVGVLLAGTFLFWWFRQVRRIWNADEPDYYGRAAAIATGTILAHSIVDYPLRTAGLSAVFCMALALMAGVRPFVRRSKRAGDARHLTF